MLISDNTQIRKNYYNFNMIQKGNAMLLRRFPKDYFAADVDRSKCSHATSSKALFCVHYVGNVIYYKFSHNDVSYRFNGENVNVMLELLVTPGINSWKGRYCQFKEVVVTSFSLAWYSSSTFHLFLHPWLSTHASTLEVEFITSKP